MLLFRSHKDTVSFIIGEDSVFNDRIYSYLRFKDYDQNDFFNAVFLLREDTINKKVYSVFPAENKEHLLYDFSLEEHDSIWTRSLGYDSMLLVVDSLTTRLVNGQYRKTIVFREETINDPIWIEGIGSIHGPLYPTFSRTVDGGEYLNCVHLGDSLIYQITSDCNNSNTFVTQPVSPNNFIHFYPDQCRFVIEGIITANSLLQIFSINGNLIDQISGDGDIELHPSYGSDINSFYVYTISKLVHDRL